MPEGMDATQRLEPWDAPRAEAAAILVLDGDDGAEGERVSSILAEAGKRPHRAGIDERALSLLVEVQPGLLVLCLDTPDDRFAALIDHLRSRYGVMAPPLLVVTGASSDQAIQAFLGSGVRDVLSKPVSPALLRVKAQQHFRPSGIPPEPIAGYVCKRRLGVGGMGAVYLAVSGGVELALKLIDVRTAASEPELVVRFRREAEVLKQLDGRGAPKFVESGRSGDYFFCAMEHVRGATLKAVLERSRLPERAVVNLVMHLASALARVHQAGFVHRDLKPSNIIMAVDGMAKLIDFGLAKAPKDQSLTSSSCVLGTPAYIAPEVLQGKAFTPASDAFALGMTALEAALGYCPVRGTAVAIVDLLSKGRVPVARDLLPGSEAGLVHVLDGLLAADPARRLRLPEAVRSLGG